MIMGLNFYIPRSKENKRFVKSDSCKFVPLGIDIFANNRRKIIAFLMTDGAQRNVFFYFVEFIFQIVFYRFEE